MNVVLIDAANLAYRAGYSNGNLTTSKGKPTGVIYGFIRILDNIYKQFENAVPIIFWEGGVLIVSKDGKSFKVQPHAPTWRKDLPGNTYKAQREITPEVLKIHAQIPDIQKALGYLRYPQLSVPRLEGDDLIGIAAAKLLNMDSVKEIAILSNDKDFFQCINHKTFVYRPGKGQLKKVTSLKVFKEFGVSPEQWATYKAFIGDASDHYDGINGCGPKKAAEMVAMGADCSLDWEDQPKALRVKYKCFKDQWKEAKKCYKFAVIPRSANYGLFDAELTASAKEAFKGFEDKLHRQFTKRELQTAIDLFTNFCSEFELISMLSDRRRYFKGAIVDGNVLQ